MKEFDLIIHYTQIDGSDMYNCHEVGELVRCKDCVYWKEFDDCMPLVGECNYHNKEQMIYDDYCSYGEKR